MRGPYAAPQAFTTGIIVTDTDSGTASDASLLTTTSSNTDTAAGVDTESIVRTTVALEDLGVGQDEGVLSTNLTDTDAGTGEDREEGSGSYQLLIASDSPIAYWRFGETTGTIADDFIGTNDGTYVAVQLGEPGAIYNDSDTSIHITGESVDYPRVRWYEPTWLPFGITYTFEAWARTSKTNPSALWSYGAGDQLLILVGDTSTQVYSGTASISLSHDSIADGAFHHFVFTHDGSVVQMYIDGIFQSSAALATITSAGAGSYLVMGQGQDAADAGYSVGQAWDGHIDEAAVYNYALTPTQILEHYEAGINSVVDGDFGGGADTTLSEAALEELDDSATSEESSTLIVAITADTDVSSTTEIASAAGNEAIDNDPGTAVDGYETITGAISDSDVAVGADSAAVVNNVATTDSATATESQQLVVLLSQPDTGAGLDTGFNSLEFFDFDSISTVIEAEKRTRTTGLSPVSPPYTQQRYEDFVLEARPVGYWRLGETEGTVAYDSSGMGYDGTYVGGPILGTTGAIAGSTNTAASFDGYDDHVSVNSAPRVSSGLNSFTFEVWVKPSATGTNDYIFSEGTEGDVSQGLATLNWDGDSFRFLVYQDGNNGRIASSPAGFLDGLWHHVVGTYSADDDTLRIYVDGVQVGEVVYGFAARGALTTSRIGRASHANTAEFPGDIDEAAKYDRALTPYEIGLHYEIGALSRYGFAAVEPSSKPSVIAETAEAYQFDWATTPA